LKNPINILVIYCR